jgi:hypothetical protein
MEGFSEASSYWDKLSQLREEEKSLKEIIASFCTYYSTNVCTRVSGRKHELEDGEELPPKGKMQW